MKKLILVFVIGLCFCGWADMESHPSNTHQCIDKTHKTCDGECECDGLECPEVN
jgi:hypothetical protein